MKPMSGMNIHILCKYSQNVTNRNGSSLNMSTTDDVHSILAKEKIV